MTIYTIGHSNHPVGRLIDLLCRRRVARVVDVRSVPYSKRHPQFRKRPLSRSLASAKLDYVYLGDRLGGLGHGDAPRGWSRRASEPDFIEGLERLMRLAAEMPTALMCAEEDPTRCHRRLLITPALRQRGWTVVHLRAGGEAEDDDHLAPRERDVRRQLSLPWDR